MLTGAALGNSVALVAACCTNATPSKNNIRLTSLIIAKNSVATSWPAFLEKN